MIYSKDTNGTLYAWKPNRGYTIYPYSLYHYTGDRWIFETLTSMGPPTQTTTFSPEDFLAVMEFNE